MMHHIMLELTCRSRVEKWWNLWKVLLRAVKPRRDEFPSLEYWLPLSIIRSGLEVEDRLCIQHLACMLSSFWI